MSGPFEQTGEEMDDNMMAFLADISAECGGRFAPITYAWVGSFDPDGGFQPDEREDLQGMRMVPTVIIGTYVGGRRDEHPGRTFRKLLYHPATEKYFVFETEWERTLQVDPVFPIGKLPPDGTAPFTVVEGDSDDDYMLRWRDDVGCPPPLRSHLYPENPMASVTGEGLTEDDIRVQLPALWVAVFADDER
jgi:hypothetical protein